MIHILDDDTHGQFFHSKHFPNLKYFIQTGFDAEIGNTITNYYCLLLFNLSCLKKLYVGCLTYKSLFLPNPPVSEVEKVAPTLSDSTPAYYSITKSKSKHNYLL